MKLNHLFKPITINNLEIRNRIVLSPMGIGAYNDDETVSDEYVDFVKARAKETGLIITTGARVSSRYGAFRFFGCSDDMQIPGLRRLSKAAHLSGAKIFLQILELGGADPESPWVPSVDVPLYRDEWKNTNPPKELKTSQIEELVEAFVNAALRAQESGFDGVELDGAENFLISDFICPCMNRRNDKYGGSFENRMRFPVEILREIKEVCGEDFSVGFKFNAYYDLPEGIDLNLGVKIALKMAEAGATYIHEWSFSKLDKPMSLFQYTPMPNLYQPRNTTLPIAKNLKLHLPAVPIIVVGGILKPDEADNILAEGWADMIAVGRGFIADDLWAEKAKAGACIRPCIRCHVCHHEVAVLGNLLVCSVNPDVLLQNQPEKAVHPKKVMVVGAGPGGITAALTADQRGHNVNLYEKEDEIGGKLIPGSAPDFKHEFGDLLRYFRDEIKSSSVILNKNCTVTPSVIREKAPDVLIIATGAEAFLPAIPGIDRQNVIQATEALINTHRYENGKLVIIGGGDVGCETAVLMARRGNDVSIVEMLPALMETEEIKHNTVILEQLILEADVSVYTSSTITEITDNAVLIRRSKNNMLEIPVDLVVLATGYTPAAGRVMELRKECRTSYALGDCMQPGRLRNAISEGYRIGRLI